MRFVRRISRVNVVNDGLNLPTTVHSNYRFRAPEPRTAVRNSPELTTVENAFFAKYLRESHGANISD